MKIQEFSKLTGVPAKTIRYYEEIGLLPAPARAENNYRQYTEQDLERLRLVAGARQLDISLDDVREILAMRDSREAPCRILLNRIMQKANEIKDRIQALQRLERELRELYSLGQTFPVDDVDGKNCVCHLVSERSNASVRS
jgi:DNA-binding transcriptional MerR regulator